MLSTFESSSEDEGTLAQIEALWLAEAERRFAELNSAVVHGVAADEVFQQARESLPGGGEELAADERG